MHRGSFQAIKYLTAMSVEGVRDQNHDQCQIWIHPKNAWAVLNRVEMQNAIISEARRPFQNIIFEKDRLASEMTAFCISTRFNTAHAFFE